jgi:hypothetical protein
MHTIDNPTISIHETPDHAWRRILYREPAKRAGEKEIASQLRRTYGDLGGAIDRARDAVLSRVKDRLHQGDLDEVSRKTLLVEVLRGFEVAATLFQNRRPVLVSKADSRA